jgi:hypothetical protein
MVEKKKEANEESRQRERGQTHGTLNSESTVIDRKLGVQRCGSVLNYRTVCCFEIARYQKSKAEDDASTKARNLELQTPSK